MKTTFIYTLSDSNDNIRYIGKTNDPKYRLKKHLLESKYKRTYKEKWIDSVIKTGENIKLEIIDEVDNDNWCFWETYWISQFRTWGFDLVNGTSGGEGSDGFRGRSHSNETKQKLRETALKSEKKPVRLYGDANGRAKYTESTVNEIKEKVSLGISRDIISKEYNISKKYIYQLITGKRRKIK